MKKILLVSLVAVWSLAATAVADDVLLFGNEGLDVPNRQFILSVNNRSIDLLTGVMNQPIGPSRIRMAGDLGQCGSAALPALIKAMGDPDPLLRATAASSAGKIGGPQQPNRLVPSAPPAVLLQTVQALEKLVSDPDPAVRREAVLAASRLGDIAAVTTALADADEQVLAAALLVASTPQQAAAISQRYPKLSPRLQAQAALALGRIGDASCAGVLLPLPDYPVNRAAAIHGLGQMKPTTQASLPPTAQSALVAALNFQTEHPTVRREAILALGQLAAVPDRQKYAMGVLAGDPDAPVREAAAEVLQGAPTADALPLLSKQLDDEYVPLHDAARTAMVDVGDPVIALAVQLMDNTNPRRREDGSYILGQLRSSVGLERHIALLADSDLGVAAQAAESMYRIVPPADVAGSALMALLNRIDKLRDDNGGAAGRAAILAAGRIRYKPIAARCVRWVAVPPPKTYWPPSSWRPASVWAIGMAADSQSPEIQKLVAVLSDSEQGAGIAFEAIKAMANCGNRDKDLIELLKHWDTNALINRSVATRWMAHLVYDRLSGTTTPYTAPPPLPFEPEVSIKDLP